MDLKQGGIGAYRYNNWLEAWQSGLSRRTRNAVGEQSPRRFESSRFRINQEECLEAFLLIAYDEEQEAVASPKVATAT